MSINGVYVANRKHIRFSILLMFMALVGGALVEFDGNSALEDCDQGGHLCRSRSPPFWSEFVWNHCQRRNFSIFAHYARI